MKNSFKTMFFMIILTGLLIFAGGVIGGQSGIIFAFILSLVMNLGSYWFSDKIVLKLYRAREITEIDNPELYGIVRRLASKAMLPMPKVYIVPEASPNAFATGRSPSHSAVAVTEGILKILSREELEGVISHELAHIKNRDTLISTIVAAVAGAIMMLASMAKWAAIFGVGRSDDDDGGGLLGILAMAILAPIAAMIIQMAISRSREYMADTSGAKIAGNKYGLINGLKKIHSAVDAVPMQTATQNTAHLMIANPFSGKSLMKLFSTHPDLQSRIDNLMSAT